MGRFAALLHRARQGDQEALGELLNHNRERLRVIANQELGHDIQVRVDASDVVQQTVLSAVRQFRDFVGSNEEELLAWLERILERNVQDTVRFHFGAKKRTVSQEVPLDPALGAFSGCSFASEEGEGIAALKLMENVDWLMAQLDALPPDQGFAVRMRHLEGKDLEDVAIIMGRTKLAVAGLIKRGLQRLRQRAQDEGSGDS